MPLSHGLTWVGLFVLRSSSIGLHVGLYKYYYMKIHVPSMLAIGIEMINKQTQQTSSHNGL